MKDFALQEEKVEIEPLYNHPSIYIYIYSCLGAGNFHPRQGGRRGGRGWPGGGASAARLAAAGVIAPLVTINQIHSNPSHKLENASKQQNINQFLKFVK